MPILFKSEEYELLLIKVIQFFAPALLANNEERILTSSSFVTAMKLSVLSILTSSKISFSETLKEFYLSRG